MIDETEETGEHIFTEHQRAEFLDELMKGRVTPSTHSFILALQDDRCAVCHKAAEYLVIDHDHETGKVRGLICYSCNTGLGAFRDSVETLQRAIAYLSPDNLILKASIDYALLKKKFTAHTKQAPARRLKQMRRWRPERRMKAAATGSSSDRPAKVASPLRARASL